MFLSTEGCYVNRSQRAHSRIDAKVGPVENGESLHVDFSCEIEFYRKRKEKKKSRSRMMFSLKVSHRLGLLPFNIRNKGNIQLYCPYDRVCVLWKVKRTAGFGAGGVGEEVRRIYIQEGGLR